MLKEITMVGCGTMGSTLIGAVMAGGVNVSIVDLNEKAASKFVEKGAKYAKSLDEIDITDVILLNLPQHSIASKVIKACTKDLTGKMLIDTTTSTPAEVKDMQAIASERGMKYLDAKLEVYPSSIGPDTGYIVYSGDKEVFDTTKNVLDSLGKAVYLGEDVIGASVTDIAVLEVHFAAIGAMIEAAAFAIKNNISVPQIMEQIQNILPIMIAGNFKAFGEQLENYNGKFEPAKECSLNIEATALQTIVKAINESGAKTPCGDAVLKMFNDGIDHGYADNDAVAVVNEIL